MAAGEHSRRSSHAGLRGNAPRQACLVQEASAAWCHQGAPPGRVLGCLCSLRHSPTLHSYLGAGGLRSPQGGLVLRPAPPLGHRAPASQPQGSLMATLIGLSLWSGAVSSGWPDWGHMPTLSGDGAAPKGDAAGGASSRRPSLTSSCWRMVGRGCWLCGSPRLSSEGRWLGSATSPGYGCWHPQHICLSLAVPEGLACDPFCTPEVLGLWGAVSRVLVTKNSWHRLALPSSLCLPNVVLWAQRFQEAFLKPSASRCLTPANHRTLM